MATARRKTAAEAGCTFDPDATDITVCGLRNADRFRVPFVGYEPGDPRAESVSGERDRLLARTNNCEERRAIAVGCGMFGAHMTTSARGTSVAGVAQQRELAP
ncbi:hypothetical protein I6F14_36740 [Bradyrhizobium sp. IC3069]|nr:hypothetical protein [Bradyrhizobium sp. IC3069]